MIGRFSRSIVIVVMACAVIGAAFAFARGVPLKPAQSCDDSQVSYGSVCAASSSSFGRTTNLSFVRNPNGSRSSNAVRVTTRVLNSENFTVRAWLQAVVTYSGGSSKTITGPKSKIASGDSKNLSVFIGVPGVSSPGGSGKGKKKGVPYKRGKALRASVKVMFSAPSGQKKSFKSRKVSLR